MYRTITLTRTPSLPRQKKKASAPMTGILLVDKPKGPTSHDVVQSVRRLTGQRRCGHTGTLDPFATGLLPLCLGRATRLARFVSGAAKTYIAVVRFGFATDTYDLTGQPMGPPADVGLDRSALESELAEFVGVQDQVPPPFAAKKIDGKRMYQLARAGRPVPARPVKVSIHAVRLLGMEGDRATLEAEVGAGTYIRSLAHDLGKRFGCGAHLVELRRSRVGHFRVEQAWTLSKLESLAREGRLKSAVLDPAEALSNLPALRLGSQGASRVRHGRSVTPSDVEGLVPDVPAGQACRLLGPEGELLAVGVAAEELHQFRPLVVLATPN